MYKMAASIVFLLSATFAVAIDWREAQYYSLFLVGKADTATFFTTVRVADNGDGVKWNRGYTMFYRSTTGKPFLFPKVTFTGEKFIADYDSFFVPYKGTRRISITSSETATAGWMFFRAIEEQPLESESFLAPVTAHSTIETRDQNGNLIYSLVGEFQRARKEWGNLYVEKGLGIVVLNPNLQAAVITLKLWRDEETSNSSRRGGPQAQVDTDQIPAGSTLMGFVEEFWPTITVGTLDISSSVPIAVFIFQAPAEILKPILGSYPSP